MENEGVVNVKKVKEAFAEEQKETEESEEIESGEENEEEDDSEFDMESMNLGSVLQTFLVSEEGLNICDILTGLKKSMDTQNKILMKIVNNFENKKK
tara:strand:- start:6669 stop:6959 length:291 start_codon:yes stop_codon:yes gene_type:complete